jgi:hypothetical protein
MSCTVSSRKLARVTDCSPAFARTAVADGVRVCSQERLAVSLRKLRCSAQ